MLYITYIIVIALLCFSSGYGAAAAPAAAGGGKSSILINALCAGSTYEVQVEPGDTVGAICSALCKSTHLKVDQHAVYYRGKVMNKRKSLLQSGIQEGDLISIKPSDRTNKKANRVTNRNVNFTGSLPSLKSPDVIQEEIKQQRHKDAQSGMPTGTSKSASKRMKYNDSNNNKNSNNNPPTWDWRKLQDLIANGSGADMDFLSSVTKSLKTNPMDMLGDLMGSNYLEDLVSSDTALESMRLLMKQNAKQYDHMFPGFSSQAKVLTSSPAAFKMAIRMAMLQLKTLKKGASSSSFSNDVDSNISSVGKESALKGIWKKRTPVKKTHLEKKSSSNSFNSNNNDVLNKKGKQKSSTERLVEQIQYREDGDEDKRYNSNGPNSASSSNSSNIG